MKTKNNMLILSICLFISSIGVVRAMVPHTQPHQVGAVNSGNGYPRRNISKFTPTAADNRVDCVGFRAAANHDFSRLTVFSVNDNDSACATPKTHDDHPLILAMITKDFELVESIIRQASQYHEDSEEYQELVPKTVRFQHPNALWKRSDPQNIPLIFFAVRQSHPQIMRAIALRPYGNIHTFYDTDERTILHEAVCFGHCPILEMLIALGASALRVNNRGQTPRTFLTQNCRNCTNYDEMLMILFRAERQERIRLAQIMQHTQTSTDRNSLIDAATQMQHVELLNAAIQTEHARSLDVATQMQHAVSLNAATQARAESLDAATQMRHAKLLDAMTQTQRAREHLGATSRVIPRGCSQRAIENELSPDAAFHRALVLNDFQKVVTAIERGAKIYEMFQPNGNKISGMFEILLLCNREIVELVLRILIAGEFYINGVYSDVGTLLHAAVANSGLDVVKCVLDLGALPSQINGNGNTPLGLARLLKQNTKQDKAVPRWLQAQMPQWKKSSLPRHTELDRIIRLLQEVTMESIQDKKDRNPKPQWQK